MARLNETTQPAPESIDALKRRFVRQNREIARANSTQSLRIRSLEGEVSRLLGENVSLREQIIKLHYEVESNVGRAESSQIDSFKTKLEIKLREVGALVEELGQAQCDAKKRGHQKRKSTGSTSSPKRSPSQRIWRNTQTLSDLMGDAEGRLPPILEDKCFPRQTLNSDELHCILADPANLTDSPDLGPPPIAHFEEGDPIKFDARDSRRVSKDRLATTECTDLPLSANLETRRKRRDSSRSKDALSKTVSPEAAESISAIQNPADSSQPVKIGAKRKLNMRDEDEQPLRAIEKDDFQFERKEAPKLTVDKSSKTTISKGLDRPLSRAERNRGTAKENGASVSSAGRRALGPKSANTDPQSPAKVSVVGANDKPTFTREILAQTTRDQDSQREKPRAKTPVEPTKLTARSIKVKRPDNPISHEPETPAPPPLDLLSPASTEPSARQEGRGDTPPPPDLGPDTGTGSFGRASRRPRGSVSYAEPSLRDKMRRPTKELVDAVGAEERARQARAMKMGSIESALARIKTEDDNTDTLPDWKTMRVGDSQAQKERQKAETTSPLGQKAVVAPPADLPSSVSTERKRRASTLTRAEEEEEDEGGLAAATTSRSSSSSGAASAIAALAMHKRGPDQSGRHRREEDGEGRSQRHSDRTSIYDFTGSSPVSKGKTTAVEQEEEGEERAEAAESKPAPAPAPSQRSARRHSSVPALSDHGRGSLAISRRTRRESMM